MTWNDVTIDMKPTTCTRKDVFHVEEELFVSDKTDLIAKILDSKYKHADLKELTDNLSQLNNNQKNNYTHYWTSNARSLTVHQAYGKGHCTKSKCKMMQNHITHVCAVYHTLTSREDERLCKVGVLRKINRSEWAAPTFLIPKKDRTV